MNCPNCGKSVAGAGPFCQFCGTNLSSGAVVQPPALCAQCGTVNTPGNVFCHTCGKKLSLGVSPLGTTAGKPGSATVGRPARLVTIRRDGSDGPSHAVPGDQFDLGRTDGDLRLDDPYLDARHARIAVRAGQYVIIPLETRNGVYVRLRDTRDLLDGDFVLLGKQLLRFELLSDVEKSLRAAVENGVVLFGSVGKTPWGRLRQLSGAGVIRDIYHLSRPETIMGREQGDIVFSDDEFLSRRHAMISFSGGRVTVQDLSSSNGTFVRLRVQHPLTPGEMIRIGDQLLRFEIG